MSSGAGQDPVPDARWSGLDDDVRRELARLGRDSGSAPQVPPEVTARIGAALRAASHGRAHTPSRPRLSGAQRAGLLAAISAVAAGVIVAVMSFSRPDAPTFPASPTASHITVSGPADPFPLSDVEVLAALGTAPDLGPLADARRREDCLAGLGYPAEMTVLGGRRVEVAGQPAVLLLLPGATSVQVSALVVRPSCNGVQTGLLARTVVARR
ncbi:hypothetical protein ACNUDN_28295 [Mycobacterium sp. smrl_JER01]|uniref:hypothetical protein n=1 Tax=Mycobacterium sp. smrl_JER01 TaxID=3402633 RepID=UPI003ACE501D